MLMISYWHTCIRPRPKLKSDGSDGPPMPPKLPLRRRRPSRLFENDDRLLKWDNIACRNHEGGGGNANSSWSK